jgi:amidase
MASIPTDAGVLQLRELMDSGETTAVEIAEHAIARINALNAQLNCVIEVNPDVLDIATALDREQREGGLRGPLHGVPVLLKDNIDTADRQGTTAGSLALVGTRPAEDAFVTARLRQAGALILGKANLSEWANIRSTNSSSGWSAVGGQCRNPYDLDHTPCGSSSGSAAAVAADLVPVSLGTETDGSILCPGSACSVVGIKPTVGLTSRSGVIPISHTQDTVGPFGRTVADAAVLLGAITGVDPNDPATSASEGRFYADYAQFLDDDGLRGARIGVPRERYFGGNAEANAAVEAAIEVMRELGAEIVDPVAIPSAEQIAQSQAELTILLYELKTDLAAYLADRPNSPVRTLADVIRFNEEHATEEMPFFGQELFLMAEEKGPLTDPAYREALEESRRLSRIQGIDAVMDEYRLDALIGPGAVPWPIDLEHGDPHGDGASLSTPAAMAGYPAITVPAGYAGSLPVGLILTGRAFSEPILIRIAHAFERATRIRQRPPVA